MRRLMLAAILVVFCCGDALATPQSAAPAEALFLADPQIHNIYGTRLKQMLRISDIGTGVAIRHPEMNLLAPLVLRYSIQEGQKNLKSSSSPIVILGDSTNIACSGEADVFDAELSRGGEGRVRLIAHGNHDSYLMGTANSYIPTDEYARDIVVASTEMLPVEESWWKPLEIKDGELPDKRNHNWRHACYRPAADGKDGGTPLNKNSWLARYTKYLEGEGLELKAMGVSADDGIRLVGAARTGTQLGAMNYRVAGVWYRPQAHAPAKKPDYQRASKSYIVQAVDLDAFHTLVLIDTSVCIDARGGGAFAFKNAGSRACLGDTQLNLIAETLQSVPAGRHLIIGAHFPLKDFRRRERRALIKLMENARPDGWVYASAHTHEEHRNYPYGNGVDINIGSTTDWPMESHVMRFGSVSAKSVEMRPLAVGNSVKSLVYTPISFSWGEPSELCRHFNVAKALALANPEDHKARWMSPGISSKDCGTLEKKWQTSSVELLGYQDDISRRFDSDEQYKDFILSVAAAASLNEHRSFNLGKVIP